MELTSRTAPRALVGTRCEATVSFGSTSFSCSLLQVGTGGVLLGIDQRMALPERFEVSFRVPGNPETFEETVELRHRMPRGGFRLDLEQPTAGCQFIYPGASAKQAVLAFMEQQRTTLKQLQFGLALMPPSPRVLEYATKLGVNAQMPVPQLKQFVTWCIKQLTN